MGGEAAYLNHDITLALIAHDRKKEELADFVLEHRVAFNRFHLVATRGTGTLIKKRTGLTAYLLGHGPEGGDQQISALVAANEVQAVIFFRDAHARRSEPDFADLLRVCDLREIVLATNRSTAEAVLYFLQNSPDRAVIAARPWGFALPTPRVEFAR